MRTLMKEIRKLQALDATELCGEAKRLQAPLELVQMVAKNGRLPVPNFSAGGVATPADAALMMQLGAETVFVGSGIFMEATPAEAEARAKAVVKATAQFANPAVLLEASTSLPKAMTGVEMKAIPADARLAQRGW
jgi:pyridoxal 5'-phosphate synthase pdxS subunit